MDESDEYEAASMAYEVMAYRVLAYIAMAYIVMAYVFMAPYIVMVRVPRSISESDAASGMGIALVYVCTCSHVCAHALRVYVYGQGVPQCRTIDMIKYIGHNFIGHNCIGP